MPHDTVPNPRRGFLARVSAALAGVAALGTPIQPAGAQTPRPPRDVPRHPQDAWFDQLPGAHRLLLDAVSPYGSVEAVMFAWNFLRTSGAPYGLKDADHAVVVVLRHNATIMALPQTLWDKYPAMAPKKPFENPLAETTSQTSILRPGATGSVPEPFQLDGLAKRGIHYAICGAAMTRLAGQAAGRGGDAKALYAELEAALPTNSHIMPSGITAAQRAQEYGYSYAHTG
jgi:intracellular sulfur oxidation DsrE/DsrF family protein